MLLELGVGADILRGIGWLIWLLIALALGVAFTKPKTMLGKAVAVSLVLGIVAASIFVPSAIRQYEHKQRYAKAKALFDARCKTAGEKIYRTVEGVEGIVLKNPRQRRRSSDKSNIDWIGAGFPGASGGGRYIMEFLFYNHPPKNNYSRALDWNKGGTRGYQYVENIENNIRYRYQLKEGADYVNDPDPIIAYGRRELAPDSGPDYLVEYENIYDEEGRKNWIAGGKVIVKNVRTNELLGELVGYSFDRGMGNIQGERSPWGFAIQCPLPVEGTSVQIRSFVEKVIKPKQGDENE